jgi:hypothetical protein
MIYHVMYMTWSNMWYDMIWYMMRYMIWYDIYDMIYDVMYMTWYNMIYLLTAIRLTPGGSSTVHIYTQTIHRTTQNTQYLRSRTTQKLGRVRTVPRLCEVYPGICLTTEEKARKNLSEGSIRVPFSTMKIHKQKIRMRRHNNKNT